MSQVVSDALVAKRKLRMQAGGLQDSRKYAAVGA